MDISVDQVCFIIMKAREFDGQDVSSGLGAGSNAADDDMVGVLEMSPDNPVVAEITSYINAMSVDDQIDLVGLMWLGRGDYTEEDWDDVRGEAAAAHNERTAEYLLGTPLVADYLEEGLSLLGRSCEEFEADHL